MRKEFAVKNATFVYDNSVEVMKKTFEYDGAESQSFNDINDYEATQVIKSAVVLSPTYFGGLIFIVFTLASLIASCCSPIDFMKTNLFDYIFFSVLGVLAVKMIVDVILIKKRIIIDLSSSCFDCIDAKMKKIDNLLVYKEFKSVKTFELVRNMWEDSDETGWALITTSVNPDEPPLLDNLTRNFKFADAENYRPGDNIEINCIDRTISVRK